MNVPAEDDQHDAHRDDHLGQREAGVDRVRVVIGVSVPVARSSREARDVRDQRVAAFDGADAVPHRLPWICRMVAVDVADAQVRARTGRLRRRQIAICRREAGERDVVGGAEACCLAPAAPRVRRAASSAVLTRPSGPAASSACSPFRKTPPPTAVNATAGCAPAAAQAVQAGASTLRIRGPRDGARVARGVDALDRLARLLAGDQLRRGRATRSPGRSRRPGRGRGGRPSGATSRRRPR